MAFAFSRYTWLATILSLEKCIKLYLLCAAMRTWQILVVQYRKNTGPIDRLIIQMLTCPCMLCSSSKSFARDVGFRFDDYNAVSKALGLSSLLQSMCKLPGMFFPEKRC